MVKTIREIKDELSAIRGEVFEKGETADSQMIASWLDRLVITLEELCVPLELMAVELETLSNSDGAPVSKPSRKPAMKKKKPAKKAKKKKSRR